MFPPYWILIITRKSGNSRETQNQFESVAREFRVFHFIFFRFHLSFVQNCVEFAINCIASRVRLISCNPTTCRHCVGVTKLDSVGSRLSTTEYLRAAHRSASLRNENWIHGFSLQITVDSDFSQCCCFASISDAVYSIYVMQSVNDGPALRK